jgi:hypothetical protein
MKTIDIFPFNTVVVRNHNISLKEALEWGRRRAAQQGGNPVRLAALCRQRVIAKPRGRLGYTFREWSRSFKTGGPAFHQGR